MTTPKADIPIEPVMLTNEEAAALLGRGARWFLDNRKELERAGFPQPDPVFKLYYRRAIIAWLDARHGIGEVRHGHVPTAVDPKALENWD